jgi:hypothetical protein
MVIKNKPTFDPYSLADFEARDAFKSGVRTWRSQKASCLAVTYLSMVPILGAHLVFDNRFITLFCGLGTIPFAVTVISPLIARDARGLSSDVLTGLKIMRARLLIVTMLVAMISSLVAAPSLMLLLLGDLAACGGLVMGAVCASPLVLALPTSVIESVGFWSALKRSLFLIRGRWVKALSVIFLCISLACIGATVRFFFPSATFYIVPFEPILISWSAVGLGALYLHLYDH